MKVLRLIPEVLRGGPGLTGAVEEVAGRLGGLEKRVAGVEAWLHAIEGELGELREAVSRLGDSLDEAAGRLAGLERRMAGVELTLRALAEAFPARVLVEEIKARGYQVRKVRRNVAIDDEDIDVVVVGEVGGRVEHFIAEVKVKPRHSDVGSLLAKAELYEAKTGVKPRPILAGVWVGVEVKRYSRQKGVEVVEL